ncbi:MAG: BON domain-containing protein [Niastella sp.]|jgi:hyperosmotically inducible protein|uniref:BON domain-containing protein n=1 Tax=Niastella sp. TaxID=1869183 RepID=UPI00389A1F04
MRKNSFSGILLFVFITLFSLSACGPKDSKIQAAVETAIRNNPAVTGIAASVHDGVVTLSGECKDEASKSEVESEVAKVKGVKKVVNNCTVTPPPMQSAPVTIAQDDALLKNVKDAIKSYPGVNATVNDGVVTLTGDIKRVNLQKLMMSLQSLKPKKIDNQLTIK